MTMATERTEIERLLERRYDAGFVTDIESDTLPPGLNEDVVRFISAKKGEPEWLLEWRLKALRGISLQSMHADPSSAMTRRSIPAVLAES